MLRAERPSLGYPGRTLLEGLTLEFRPGQVWAGLGRNGNGKSTLLQEETHEFWGSVRDFVLLGRYPHGFPLDAVETGRDRLFLPRRS